MELRAGPRRAPQCYGLESDVVESLPRDDDLGQFGLFLFQGLCGRGVCAVLVEPALDVPDLLQEIPLLATKGAAGHVEGCTY